MSLSEGWQQWMDHRAAAIRQSGRWRTLRDFDAVGPVGTVAAPVQRADAAPALVKMGRYDPVDSGRERPDAFRDEPVGNRPVVSFASNDYLGLTHHPAVLDGARRALERWGAGTGASRLIVGSRPLHRELEAALAAWKGTERCVCFSTGFAANLGVLNALGDRDVTVFSDELNHASIVDGCRLARAEVVVYPHLDVGYLAKALQASATQRVIIVSDAVFSMDGDRADIAALVRLSNRYGSLLILDEAHCVLPFPPDQARVLSAATTAGSVVRMGTLSKTLGSMGGFAACNTAIADLIVNTARSFIFTTALSPPDAGAALAALGVIRSGEGESLVRRLGAHVEAFCRGHGTPIVPVVIGPEGDALRASRALEELGLLVPAIRPPTVPEGTSRLRISFSADHTGQQVQDLIAALSSLGLP